MIRAVSLVLALLVSVSAFAEDDAMRVRASLTTNSMNVAQRTTLRVVCEVAQGWTLVDHPFDSMGVDDSLGDLNVVARPRATPARIESGWTTTEWIIELAPGLPVTGTIPALRFKAELLDGDRFTIKRTEPIPIVVESLLAKQNPDWEPTALRPALEPLQEPEESNMALVVSIGAVAVVIAGAVGLTFVERRRRDPVRARARRMDSYQSQAQGIDTTASADEVASAAQAVVRRAMSESAGPKALAVTGESLGPLLRHGVGLNATDASLICDFFARVDGVLYPDGDSDSAQAGDLRADALRAVKSIRSAIDGGGYG